MHTAGRMAAGYSIIILIIDVLLIMDGWRMLHREAKWLGGINAHLRYGLAKKAIRNFQEQVRKADNMLKPCSYLIIAMCIMYSILHKLHTSFFPRQFIQWRLEKFVKVQMASSLKHTYTSDCPVYILQSDLEAGTSITKWYARERLGVHLRPSMSILDQPLLFWTLALVWFHCNTLWFYETIRFNKEEMQLPLAWQLLNGFDHEDRFRKNAPKPEMVKQHFWVVPPVEMETAGENDALHLLMMTCLHCHLHQTGSNCQL